MCLPVVCKWSTDIWQAEDDKYIPSAARWNLL